jgi:hypothetical protein
MESYPSFLTEDLEDLVDQFLSYYRKIFLQKNYKRECKQILENLVIHDKHINGIRNDNRIENLELWSCKHPPGQRGEDKVAWCKEFLLEYGYKVIKDDTTISP